MSGFLCTKAKTENPAELPNSHFAESPADLIFVIDHTHSACKTVKTAVHLSFAHFFVKVVFEGSLQQMTMAQNKAPAPVDINSIVAKALEMLDSEELLSLLGDSARVPTPNDPSAEAQGSIARDNTQEQSLHTNRSRR
jgi:hypothetical protein